MKKTAAILLFFVLLLTGCVDKTVIPEVGDFSFDLPAGYSIADVTEKNCTIIRDEDNAVAGGMEVTTLTLKDVSGSKSDNIMLYLQNDFHNTNNVEYITSHWGEKHKIVSVNLKKHTDDGQEEMYTHLFFEKDLGIYHIWLYQDVVDAGVQEEFRAMTGVD